MGQSDKKTVIDFTSYVTDRTRVFTGRGWVFESVNDWLAEPEGPRFFLITGEPGSGKTAIAARLTQFSQGEVSPPDDLTFLTSGFLSAVHFCSARDRRWINPHVFTESLALQLSARYPAYAKALVEKSGDRQVRIEVEQQVREATNGQVIGVVIKKLDLSGVSSEDAFIRVVREPLEALFHENSDEQVVILVDALDEALLYSGRVDIISLLTQAEYPSTGVRFILTSRPETEVLRPLRRFEPEDCSLTSEEGLTHSLDDVQQHVLQTLARRPELAGKLASNLPVDAFASAVQDKSDGNFLYVRHLLEMLETQEEKISRESLDKLPDGLDGIYIEFLGRLVGDDEEVWEEKYAPVLGTLAVAQEALTEKRLAGFVGTKKPQVRKILKSLRQFLEVDESLPASERTYAVYHRSFTDFLLDEDWAEEYWCEAFEQHDRIVEHYHERCEGDWPKLAEDDYACYHLAVHLVEAGQVETLRGLLFNFDWLQAKLEATDVNALIADYDLLPDDADLRLVQSAIQLSAHVLTRDKTQIAGQLLGRLLSQKSLEIRKMLEQAQSWNAAPWLRPLTSNLTPPGGPLLRTLDGHIGSVKTVAITPDGRRAVSGSGDGTLKTWDLESGYCVQTLEGHRDRAFKGIHAVAISPDGRRAVSGSADGTLQVWNLVTGACEFTWQGHRYYVTVAITLGGRQAVSGSYHGTLKVWNLENGACERTLPGHSTIFAVAITPDGQKAVSALRDRTLKVWDLESSACERTLRGHSDGVNAVAITPDGQHAVSASSDHTLKVWDLENGACERTLEGHTNRVKGVAITPDGRLAVSASSDRTLKVWDLESGACERTLKGHSDRVNAVAITPNGQHAVSASSDRTLKVWDLKSGNYDHAQKGHSDSVRAVAITPESRRAVSASWDGTLKVWDLESGTYERTLEGHTGRVHAVAVMPDGRSAVSASDDNTLKLWDLESGVCKHTFEGHSYWIWAVATTPDGQKVVSASWDRTLKVWDLENGTCEHTLEGHRGEVKMVALTSDGRRAVSGSTDGNLRVWNLETGTCERTLEGHRGLVMAMAITPDGRRAISALATEVYEDFALKVWDLESGACEWTLPSDYRAPVAAVATALDGRRAVSASSDGILGTLVVWDLEKGVCEHALEGHTGNIRAIAITPDGQKVISASSDRTLKVWHVENGNLIADFTGESPLSTCSVAPDGVTIVAGYESGLVHFLRLEGVE